MSQESFYIVRADYEVSYPKPVILQPGDKVTCLRKDSGWPGWSWVDANGNQGWVPDSCLQDSNTTETEAIGPFDGTELSAKMGEKLTPLREEAGWMWCQNAVGETGWFPVFNLKPGSAAE